MTRSDMLRELEKLLVESQRALDGERRVAEAFGTTRSVQTRVGHYQRRVKSLTWALDRLDVHDPR